MLKMSVQHSFKNERSWDTMIAVTFVKEHVVLDPRYIDHVKMVSRLIQQKNICLLKHSRAMASFMRQPPDKVDTPWLGLAFPSSVKPTVAMVAKTSSRGEMAEARVLKDIVNA